jgi:predicted anti-sigma-YlaC factor YlaD
VVDHLQSCWSCRGHFRELCSRVEAYILSRENELPDPLSDSDRRIRELRQRLARVMETLPSK